MKYWKAVLSMLNGDFFQQDIEKPSTEIRYYSHNMREKITSLNAIRAQSFNSL